jgi:hypothetical protein
VEHQAEKGRTAKDRVGDRAGCKEEVRCCPVAAVVVATVAVMDSGRDAGALGALPEAHPFLLKCSVWFKGTQR